MRMTCLATLLLPAIAVAIIAAFIHQSETTETARVQMQRANLAAIDKYTAAYFRMPGPNVVYK